MQTAAQLVWAREARRLESAEVVENDRDIAELQSRMAPILQSDASIATPEFYIATISKRSWVPRIVTVQRGNTLLGAVYAKERKVGGIRTGIIYADATICCMVAAKRAHRDAVFYSGVDALLKRRNTRALRALLPPAGYELEMLPELANVNKADCSIAPARYHLSLPLQSSYDEFLEQFGKRVRRNLRYYRRKSQGEGHTYTEEMKLSDFREAARTLARQQVVGADKDGVTRAMAIFEQAQRPILVGLRDKSGSWLSLIGGWFEGRQPVIFLQLNSDKTHANFSLSLVLRGYFFESLIRGGFRNVLFWAGVGGPLERYCDSAPAMSAYIDKRSMLWSGVRKVCAANFHLLPKRVAWCVDWIMPNATQQISSSHNSRSIDE